MSGLIIFCTGVIIALFTEDLPKWIKTIVWIFFVVIGLVLGAASSFHL